MLVDKGDSALVARQRLGSVGLRAGGAPASQLRHRRLPSARQAGCQSRSLADAPLRLGQTRALSTLRSSSASHAPKVLNERSQVSLCEIQNLVTFSVEHRLDQVNAEAFRLLEVNRGWE